MLNEPLFASSAAPDVTETPLLEGAPRLPNVNDPEAPAAFVAVPVEIVTRPPCTGLCPAPIVIV